ncbi:patatin-like phospholipase family protein [Methylobacterium sp. CB376]|uniref:patatin-like phospholipase family protein n=2 Tax=Methylobacterium TaxID=407 RepID=UPI0005BA5B62|nr:MULTISPECIES: patatin-like phospholipase family protein [Methylobacterium]WFT78573.1 patatin-like phospholipase family protein [Methylobacterium nodulans]
MQRNNRWQAMTDTLDRTRLSVASAGAAGAASAGPVGADPVGVEAARDPGSRPDASPGRRLAGPRAEKGIALALQGGGAHGAFTWGVLDALIEDGRLAFEAITGASAGAMNAVVMTHGWLKDGPEGARAQLEAFWREVSLDGDLPHSQQRAFDGMLRLWRRTPLAEVWASLASPYAANPLNINPLKRALTDTVDFEALRRENAPPLFISATNVWTGKIAVFEGRDLTADHVMASACLPTVFQAVEIDGVPYWDGGYLGNPPLYPLYHGAETRDILLIQINPVERRETPRTPQEIRDRLNEITFNGNLLRELRAIDFVQGLVDEGALATEGYRPLRLHRIDGSGELDDYTAATKLKAQWPFLLRLRDAGRAAARAWLDQHFDAVGRESSLDLRAMYG